MTDKTISDREAEQLRRKIEFINRDGGYRTVITDSESADGIAARCMSSEHPEFDRDRQWGVHDCCDTNVIETGHEHIASVWVDSLTVIPALLDERDVLRARVAEMEAHPAMLLHADQDERDGDVRAVAAVLQVYGTWPGEPISMTRLRDRFADRIAALDARDAKAGG